MYVCVSTAYTVKLETMTRSLRVVLLEHFTSSAALVRNIDADSSYIPAYIYASVESTQEDAQFYRNRQSRWPSPNNNVHSSKRNIVQTLGNYCTWVKRNSFPRTRDRGAKKRSWIAALLYRDITSRVVVGVHSTTQVSYFSCQRFRNLRVIFTWLSPNYPSKGFCCYSLTKLAETIVSTTGPNLTVCYTRVLAFSKTSSLLLFRFF